MERIRKLPKEVGLDRVFTPGRLRRQWLATAYERLVPLCRRSLGQERPENRPEGKEECRWAR
jgi:hypothetical protein